jgi:hypothetical protein
MPLMTFSQRLELKVGFAALGVLAALALWAGEARAAPVVSSGFSDDPAGLALTVNPFRAELGSPNNLDAVGSQPSGRREINWDGVPDSAAAPNNLAADFFNTTKPRGVVVSTPGTAFQVSADTSSSAPVEFGNLNSTYPTAFQPFSTERLFTPLGSNVTDVSFFVPGSTTAATVNGFGAVFTDIDKGTTSLQFFDADGHNLGLFFAPLPIDSVAEGNLVFVGVRFDAGERVAKVRIISGEAAPSASETDVSQGGTHDIVVMDDFIYGEPQVVQRGTQTQPAGQGGGGNPKSDVVAPVVSAVRVDPDAVLPAAAEVAQRRGTTFRYRLSEAASVRFSVQRLVRGRRKGRHCVKPRRSLRRRRHCLRAVTKARLRQAGVTGPNAKPFSGRVRRRALRAGRYRVVVVAIDAAGNRSKPRTARFRVLRTNRR